MLRYIPEESNPTLINRITQLKIVQIPRRIFQYHIRVFMVTICRMATKIHTNVDSTKSNHTNRICYRTNLTRDIHFLG
jgi:hypothetical protein